jgi:hypothetical protein
MLTAGLGPACDSVDQAAPGGAVEAVSQAVTLLDLAQHWAPVIYQDVYQTGGTGVSGKSDFMTRFDFDGNWNGRDNWDNLPSRATPAHLYYKVSESSSHYFIYYMAYHPRDWCHGLCEEHEHDGEGAVVLVRKNASQPYGWARRWSRSSTSS